MSEPDEYQPGERVYVLYPPRINDTYEPIRLGLVLQTRRRPRSVLVQFAHDATFWIDQVQVSRTDPRKVAP